MYNVHVQKMYQKCKILEFEPFFNKKKIAHFFLLTDKDEHFTKMQ